MDIASAIPTVLALAAAQEGDTKVNLRRIMSEMETYSKDAEQEVKAFNGFRDLEDMDHRAFFADVRRVDPQEGNKKKWELVLMGEAREDATFKSKDGYEVHRPEYFLGEAVSDALWEVLKDAQMGQKVKLQRVIKALDGKDSRKVGYLHWAELLEAPIQEARDASPPPQEESAAPVEESTPEPEDAEKAAAMQRAKIIAGMCETMGVEREAFKAHFEDTQGHPINFRDDNDFDTAKLLVPAMAAEANDEEDAA